MGLYKSADGLQTVGALRPATGFPAWPGSAIGRQVAVGAPSPVQDELYVQQSPTGGAADYPRRVARLRGNVWGLMADPGSAVQDPIEGLYRLGTNLYRISCDASNAEAYGRHPGQLQRSDDGGVSWSNVGPTPVNVGAIYWGVQAVTIGADGVLWLCCTVDASSGDGGFPAPAIYKSTAASDGLVWTKEYEDTEKYSGTWRYMLDISAHPTDSQVIAVMGQAAGTLREVHVTEDGGSSFVRSNSVGDSSTFTRLMRTMDNQRLVHVRILAAHYSDDLGDTWSDGIASVTNLYSIVRGVGGVLFVGGSEAGPDPKIYRSQDYGQTWVEFANENDFPTGADYPFGLVHNSTTDTLYIVTEQTGNAGRVLAIDSASIAGVNPTIRDLTLNLNDSNLFDGGVIAARGLALK